jgi:hypothetical protein
MQEASSSAELGPPLEFCCPNLGHLTRYTKIHRCGTWPEVTGNLERHLLKVKRRLAADPAFRVGMRLSAIATTALLEPDALPSRRR